MLQAEPIKIIIAGGGTGGHVFPAIAIANAIREKVFNARILFVGAKGRMEMTKVPAAGYQIIGLNISGLQRKLTWKNLLVPFKLCDSIVSSKNIVKRFKPQLVIGVGGYASGPLVRAAAKFGVPTLIQEQNSYPGITNKLLAKSADKICVAYEGMERFFPASKIYLTGNPVRHDILDAHNRVKEGFEYFGLSPQKKVVLIVGGSLGALSINEAVEKHIDRLLEQDLQVIWQTGKSYSEKAGKLAAGREALSIHTFIDRMDLAFAASHIVVSRAGAIAISEICALSKPAVLVPSPNVAEDHQTKNAMALVNMHAAILLPDNQVREKLGDEILDLIGDEKKMDKLKENITRLYYKDSAKTIASVALGLIK